MADVPPEFIEAFKSEFEGVSKAVALVTAFATSPVDTVARAEAIREAIESIGAVRMIHGLISLAYLGLDRAARLAGKSTAEEIQEVAAFARLIAGYEPEA